MTTINNQYDVLEYIEILNPSAGIIDGAGETIVIGERNSNVQIICPSYVAENVANKRNDLCNPNTTGYTSTLAVYNAIQPLLTICEFDYFTGCTLSTNYYNKYDINVYSGITLSNIDSRLLTSSFNTYSGITLSNIDSRLLISSFNTYSGITLSNIDSRLLISSFNTYSGITLSNIDSRLLISSFNTYSGITLSNINSRLSIDDFNYFCSTTLPFNYYDKSQINTYSANTLSIINTKLTGATNGLTVCNNAVKLGGNLMESTIISGTSELTINTPIKILKTQNIVFDNNPVIDSNITGNLYYKNNSLNFTREFSGVTLQIGEETVVRVTNTTGYLIPNGTAVYISSAVYGLPTIEKSIANNNTALKTIGLTTMDIADNNEGYVTILGLVNDVDTSSYPVGTVLYLSDTIHGGLTSISPVYPNDKIMIGIVTMQDIKGKILVDLHVETPYTSIGLFTGYTASTSVILNNKLNTCVFNTYTGNTTSIIDSLTAMCACVVTGVTNSLCKINAHSICLGGTITSPIDICGNSSVRIGDVCGITLSSKDTSDILLDSKSSGGIYLKSQCGIIENTLDFTDSVGIALNYSGLNSFTIYDNRKGSNQTGIVYADDYSDNYINRSLVDKAYVDSVAAGLDAKAAAMIATTGNTILSGLTIIDGVQTTIGMRVLVKDQTNSALNGIYSASTGTWGRTNDYNFYPIIEIGNGDLIPVLSGNSNGNSIWILTTPNPITSGDSLNYSKFSQQIGVIEGNGITLTEINLNKEISVKLSPTACGLQFNGTGLEVDYDIFRAGLCSTNGFVDIRAYKGSASGSEIPVKIDTGGTNTLYVDSSTISTCIGTPIISANNGLTKSGSNVQLGGTLTGNTTIDANSNALTLSGITNLNIKYSDNAIINDLSSTPKGLIYADNYSATYCDRSLVDKAYVDNKVITGVLACNGLTKVGDTVILGGALTGDTFINYGANRLCFINGGTSCIDVISDCSQIHVENTSLCLRSCTLGTCIGSICVTNTGIVSLSSNATNCGVKITAPSTGAIYDVDYSSGFINESLVTKRYVTGVTSTSGVQSANNGLTKSGTNVRLGGALTGNTAITGAYTLSVCGGALLNSDNGYQISGNTILKSLLNSTSIFIGLNAGNNISQVNNVANSIAIGYNTYTTKDNQIILGNSNIIETLLKGNVGVNINEPKALLHLNSGNTSPNSQPLKFTPGLLLNNTEAGSVEFDGNHLYFTAFNNGNRRTLDEYRKILEVKVNNDNTYLTTGTSKVKITIPYEINNYVLTKAEASVTTPSTGQTPTINVFNYTDNVSMLSTPITIDVNQYTSYNASIPSVVNPNANLVSTGDMIGVDVSVSGDSAKGLAVILTFELI